MSKTHNGLRLLLVEDSEDDAFFILRALKKGGVNPDHKMVGTENDMKSALMENTWDLVITDHNLPGFNSFRVLELARQLAPDLPVIIVSGLIGEDVAVSAMKAGAQDYIMKDNLARLVPAIHREIREISPQGHVNPNGLAAAKGAADLVDRHEFDRQLSQVLRESRTKVRGCALLYLNFDQFAFINETCGHIVTDDLLKQLERLLKHNLRPKDTLARIGANEFGMLLRDCDADIAHAISDAIGDQIRGYRFAVDGRPFEVSMTIDVVVAANHNKTFNNLVSVPNR